MNYFEEYKGVRNVHLSSGEDIIGAVEMRDEGQVLRIVDPMIPQVMRNPANPTQASIGLTDYRPWMSTVKHIDISVEHVMFAAKVDAAMEKAYREQVSPIDIVSAMPQEPLIKL